MEFETNEIRLKVPWGHVAAKTWGSPKNYPVLVVHGIMDNAASFDRLISLLPKKFYYVSIDLPGHGFSSHFPSGLPLEFLNFVFCIKLVLEELGWKSCASITHSIGSLLIHAYTYFCPGIIKKYVSIDSPALTKYDINEMKSRFLHIYKNAEEHLKMKDSVLYSREEIIYALQTKRSNFLKKEAAEAMFERSVTQVDGRYKYNRDARLKVIPKPSFINSDEILEFFKKETVPILYIVSFPKTNFLEEEGLREKVLDIIKTKKLIEYVLVEGNHDIHTNHPERIAPLIEKFLGQITSKL